MGLHRRSHHRHASRLAGWSSVAAQLGLNIKFFKWQLLPTIKNAVEKNFHDDHKTTVLVIDDAHLLKPTALEELRLFTNPGLPGALAGQASESTPIRRCS